MFNVLSHLSASKAIQCNKLYTYSSVCKSNSQLKNRVHFYVWVTKFEFDSLLNIAEHWTLNSEWGNKVVFRIFDRNVTKSKAWNENMTYYVMHPFFRKRDSVKVVFVALWREKGNSIKLECCKEREFNSSVLCLHWKW